MEEKERLKREKQDEKEGRKQERERRKAEKAARLAAKDLVGEHVRMEGLYTHVSVSCLVWTNFV